MKYQVLDQKGAKLRDVDLRDDVFGVEPNVSVVHQALVAHLANARQGTHDTKTRGEVQGSTRKLFRQKGTGRARQGAVRAPHRKGGGIIFGPHPRSYRKDMPKKMRRLAIRSVLSAKARDGELILVDTIEFAAPKTKEMVQVLKAVQADGSALIATPAPENGVILAARNIENVFTIPANQLNVRQLLAYRYLVMTLDAARKVEEIWGLGAPDSRRKQQTEPA